MADINIESLATGQLSANCYLVYNHQRVATIIDPGDDAEYIQSYLQDLDLTPTQIILTHGHFDHLMAANKLQSVFKLSVFLHPLDIFLVQDLAQSARQFLSIDPGAPPDITPFPKNAETCNMAGLTWQIFHTPGHTPGSITLYSSETNVAFVGDLLFAGGAVGRFDFEYSSELDLLKSVQAILSLPKNTQLYPGHGPISTVRQEANLHGKP